MKPERRQKTVVVSNALAREMETLPEKLKRWGNTALTVVLVVAVVALVIRWRINRAENARQQVITELSIAESYVQDLRRDLSGQTPEFLARFRDEAEGKASDAITIVLNSADDPEIKARALIARGDLYWQLANWPRYPGMDKVPGVAPMESSEEYLKKASDSYQQVLNSETYAKHREQAMAAHFGLAAIAENRHNWDDAKKHLQIIYEDTSLPASMRDYAARQLQVLPSLTVNLYLAPATQATTGPSTAPATQASGNAALSGNTVLSGNTRASTQPLH